VKSPGCPDAAHRLLDEHRRLLEVGHGIDDTPQPRGPARPPSGAARRVLEDGVRCPRHDRRRRLRRPRPASERRRRASRLRCLPARAAARSERRSRGRSARSTTGARSSHAASTTSRSGGMGIRTKTHRGSSDSPSRLECAPRILHDGSDAPWVENQASGRARRRASPGSHVLILVASRRDRTGLTKSGRTRDED